MAGQPQTQASAPNGFYYLHTNHLNTPQVITDENRQIVWQADYTPFGQTTITTNTLDNPLRFPGQYFDNETGLYYNYFRDYDPTTGKYIESDPIGLKGGLHTFVYAANNPLKITDPLGLDGGIEDYGYNGALQPPVQEDSCECKSASVQLPPLTEKDIDRRDKIIGRLGYTFSTITGLVASRFLGSTVGTVIGISTSEMLLHSSNRYYPGDVIKYSFKVCPDVSKDSGYTISEGKITIIFSNLKK